MTELLARKIFSNSSKEKRNPLKPFSASITKHWYHTSCCHDLISHGGRRHCPRNIPPYLANPGRIKISCCSPFPTFYRHEKSHTERGSQSQNRQKIINENYSEQEETEEAYDYLIEEEMSRLLDEAVSQLPKQCELVIVGLLAGKTLQEIAEEMQISINTAKTYKLRAIQSLRELLKDTPFLVLLILNTK